MIEKRYDHERTEVTDYYGRRHVFEAGYEIRFLDDGYEIGKYDSKHDTLYLKTKYIHNDMRKPYSERIKGSQFESEYKKLLDSYKNVSEYM